MFFNLASRGGSALTTCQPRSTVSAGFLWAAYELARVQAVAAARKEAAGKLDLQRIQQHIDGIAVWVPRLGDIVIKAGTIRKSGNAIENTAGEIKDDIERRVKEVLTLLQLDAE